MKNPFTTLFRARDKPKDVISGAPSFFFGSSGAGKSVTVQTAIQLSTVYACVRVISETIASLPLGVYQVVGDGTKKATDHPLPPLVYSEHIIAGDIFYFNFKLVHMGLCSRPRSLTLWFSRE